MQTIRHTEPNALGFTDQDFKAPIGSVDLRVYLAVKHPGAVLTRKSWLFAMAYAVFVAGLCVGLILGKWLA